MLSRKRIFDPQDSLSEPFLGRKKLRGSVLGATVPGLSSHQKESSFLGFIKDVPTRRYSRETLLSLRFAHSPSSETKQAVHDPVFLNLASSPSRALQFVNRSANMVIQIDSSGYSKLSRYYDSSSDSIKLKFSVFRRLLLGKSITRKNTSYSFQHQNTQNTQNPSVTPPSSTKTHHQPTRLPPPSHQCTHNPGPIPISKRTRHDLTLLPSQTDPPCPTRAFSSSFGLHLGSLHGTNPGSDAYSDLSGTFQPRQGCKRRSHDLEQMQMGEWRIAKKTRLAFKSCSHFGSATFWSSWSAD